MKNILFFILLFFSTLHAYQNGYDRKQVIKDFNAGDTQKYRNDHLQELNFKTLLDKHILSDENKLTNNFVTSANLQALNDGNGNIYNYYKCPYTLNGWTASIWDVDFKKGEIKCAVSEVRDLYNPIGYFTVSYPKTLDFFDKNETQAADALSGDISTSDSIYEQLYSDKYEIANSVTEYQGQDYLNVPDLLLSAILTDVDIIDVEQTKASNRLKLKDGYNSQILDVLNGGSDAEYNSNEKYISARAATLVDVYAKLSDISLEYLMYLAVFFGIFGLSKFGLPMISDKLEGVQSSHERKAPYLTGLVAGVMLFFPTSDGNLQGNPNAANTQEYSIMHTNYQRFEKSGYYLFMNWADESAKAIIDSELDSIIDRAGISSSDTLINAYAYKELYKKLKKSNEVLLNSCEQIYDKDQIKKYSGDKNRIFPTSENYTYAMSYVLGGSGAAYYSPVSKGGIVSNYTPIAVQTDGSYYPVFMLSACGKAEAKEALYQTKIDDFQAKLDSAGYHDPEKLQKKVDVVRGLIRFQYELYRDYGLLAVLGLPVTIMQTENIGTMIDNKKKVTEKLDEKIGSGKTEKAEHMLMSSLPYLWLPGGFTTYSTAKDALGGLAKAALGWIPFGIGNGIATVASSTAGLALAVTAGQTLLTLLPMISIVLIGLLRFVVIYIKIFSFHFVSFFIFPLMFATRNINAISAFTMKILATMLELPVFVLSVWLAITANSIMHSIGDAFGKKIILGMLQQNELQNGSFTQKLGIYLFDGVAEIGITVFSIIIIYKIIITIHSAIFELIELKGAERLDDIVQQVSSEASGWGQRI